MKRTKPSSDEMIESMIALASLDNKITEAHLEALAYQVASDIRDAANEAYTKGFQTGRASGTSYSWRV